MRLPWLIVATILSGFCWYFAFDLSGNYWYLLWFGPIAVLYAAFRISARQAFIISFLSYLIGRLSWLSYLLIVMPVPLAIFYTLLLPMIFSFTVLLTRKMVLKTRSAWSAFGFPVFWCLFEFVLFRFSPDGTAGSIAYTQSDFLQVVQIASLTGILGISFLVTLLPSAIAVAIYYRHEKRKVKPLTVVFSVVVIPLIFGAVRLNGAPSNNHVLTAGLAVIEEKYHDETNHPRSDSEIRTAFLYANEIARLARQGAQVVILPEKAVNVTPGFGFPVKSVLANAATNNHVSVIAGYTEFLDDSLKQNKASVISGQGQILADYQKVHLFEEEKRNGFLAGNEIATFNLDNIPCGVAICKDLDFDRFMRTYDTKQIEIMFVPAWDFIKDGWLHSRMAVLRGVENGYAIVRTAKQGALTISSDRGEVLYEGTTANNEGASLLASVPLHKTQTIYSQFGDWFGWAIFTIAIYFTVVIIKKAP